MQERTVQRRVASITGVPLRHIYVHRTNNKDRGKDSIINPIVLFTYPATSLATQKVHDLCAYLDTVRAIDSAYVGVYSASQDRWYDLLYVPGWH